MIKSIQFIIVGFVALLLTTHTAHAELLLEGESRSVGEERCDEELRLTWLNVLAGSIANCGNAISWSEQAIRELEWNVADIRLASDPGGGFDTWARVVQELLSAHRISQELANQYNSELDVLRSRATQVIVDHEYAIQFFRDAIGKLQEALTLFYQAENAVFLCDFIEAGRLNGLGVQTYREGLLAYDAARAAAQAAADQYMPLLNSYRDLARRIGSH